MKLQQPRNTQSKNKKGLIGCRTQPVYFGLFSMIPPINKRPIKSQQPKLLTSLITQTSLNATVCKTVTSAGYYKLHILLAIPKRLQLQLGQILRSFTVVYHIHDNNKFLTRNNYCFSYFLLIANQSKPPSQFILKKIHKSQRHTLLR